MATQVGLTVKKSTNKVFDKKKEVENKKVENIEDFIENENIEDEVENEKTEKKDIK